MSIDLLYLYACPLVQHKKPGLQDHKQQSEHGASFFEIIQMLDVTEEKQQIFQHLSSLQRAITVYQAPATVFNMRELVDRGCRILHFTGHGTRNNELLFENEVGEAQPISTNKLQQLLCPGSSPSSSSAAAAVSSIQLVFVSACHSQRAGEIFVAAGVPHVVAVNNRTKIGDKDAREFAKMFYSGIVKGLTVTHAFDSAKGVFAAQNARFVDQDFVLLGSSSHDVPVFKELSPIGQLRDMSPSPPPNNLYGHSTVTDCFQARQQEMNTLVSLLFSESSRIVSLFGQEGVGKSVVAVAAARYINERKIRFSDGCFVITLNRPQLRQMPATGINGIPTFQYSSIGGLCAHQMKLVISSSDAALLSVNDFFSLLSQENLSPSTLFVFDNSDELLTDISDPAWSLLTFLTRLLTEFPRITALVTSRLSLSTYLSAALSHQQQPQEVPWYDLLSELHDRFAKLELHIKPLGDIDSAMLFQRRSPTGLIPCTDIGCSKGLVGNLQHSLKRKHLLHLADHEIFPLLQGNPQRVIWSAQQLNETKGIGINELPKLIIEHNLIQSLSSDGRRIWDLVTRGGGKNNEGVLEGVAWSILEEQLSEHFFSCTRSSRSLSSSFLHSKVEFADRITLELFTTKLWPWFEKLIAIVQRCNDFWEWHEQISQQQQQRIYQLRLLIGDITREDAESQLLQRPIQSGAFLLRFSNQSGCLAVSDVSLEGQDSIPVIRHFLIDCACPFTPFPGVILLEDEARIPYHSLRHLLSLMIDLTSFSNRSTIVGVGAPNILKDEVLASLPPLSLSNEHYIFHSSTSLQPLFITPSFSHTLSLPSWSQPSHQLPHSSLSSAASTR